jgi:hypothetical protein
MFFATDEWSGHPDTAAKADLPIVQGHGQPPRDVAGVLEHCGLTWCDGNGCTSVDADAFGARLDALRAELGLRTRTKGKDVFFVDLKLAS